MLKRSGIVLVVCAMLVSPGVAMAKSRGATAKKKSYQGYQSQSRSKTNTHTHGSPWAREHGWANQARGKFMFGAKNTLLGWTELFTEPYEAAKSGRNVAGGIGRGLWNGVADTAGGAAHLVTFPIPQVDLPLPEGGV